MEQAGAARLVADSADLAQRVSDLLADDAARDRAIRAAHSFAQAETGKLDSIAARLISALRLDP